MSCQEMSCHASSVSSSSQRSIDDYEKRFNCNASVGVDGGVDTRGSSFNHMILQENLEALLSDYGARRGPGPTRGFKQKNNCFVSVLRLPFGREVVGTAILNGPWGDVKEFVEHCSAPLHRVVATYPDAIVHLVIEVAQLLRAGRELPAILHQDICTAFRRHGIHLRLHQRHRSEGDEVMPRDELAEVHRERTGGGVGTVRERLGRNGTAAMAFLEAFESSQHAPLPSSSPGYSGIERQNFGEGGLWHRRTSTAVVTSTSTRSTSEEHLVGGM